MLLGRFRVRVGNLTINYYLRSSHSSLSPSVNGRLKHMSNESTAIAGVTEPVSNVSVEEYIARRSGIVSQEEEQAEESELDAEVELEEQETEPEDDTEYADEEEEASPEEAELDLLDLSTEQIQELAKKGKSRLLQRVGELTAQKRQLEEKLQLQAAAKPTKEIPQDENPFRNISDPKELVAKYGELEQVLDDTDAILEEHEDYGPDDIITVGDREFTKREIRKANRNARESITKFIPAQEKQIAKIQQLTQMEEQYSAAAKNEVPDILDLDSEVGSKFHAMMQDPIAQQVKSQIPELGYQLEYLLAHAANSIYGKGKPRINVAAVGSKLRINPSPSPTGASAVNTRSSKPKKAAEAYSKFEQSQSVDDWISARIAKYK
jgi:hypothetical protein